MGRRGPAPTPTHLLKLRGSTLATRKREAREVKPPSGPPDPPAWLDADARAAWDELLPMLEGMGVLTRVDGRALSRYCHLWARWRKAEAFIAERGEMYPIKDDDGQVKCFQQWPQVAIAHRLAQQLTRLEQEFGMTPSARARLQLTPQGQEKPSGKTRFFNVG
ncbi:MAG: phage terminase small subunit P27 family [Phycisphaerae bacterium]|nr:phage terminase small subunit P27 family [Phycisphaerae bacterium]NUQ10608.1 phage terminase small subunit P27 family [Phycisphaerae bacterium]